MSIKQRLISAIGWSVAIKIGFQVLTWGSTLVVIRVLSPDDYGLMAIATLFTTALAVFANLGLGDAIVQRQDISKPMIQSAFGILIIVPAALTILLAFAAYPIAKWYGDPRLGALVQIASLTFFLNALGTLPRMFLAKSLRVRPIFITELSAGLIGATSSVSLALAGFGVWSLAWAALAGTLAKQIGFMVVAREYYVWPSFDVRPARPLFGYGLFSMLEYGAFTLMTSADVLIISWLLGPVDLGLYTVTLNFAGMPLNKIAPIINSVAFPTFALVQEQAAEARFYALKGLRMMALVSVPVFFGVSATAPELVDIIFGPAWSAARPLLAVLSLALAFRACLIVIPNYLFGMGDSRGSFFCTATGAVIFPIAILIGCSWGIMGACYAWLVCYPAVYCLCSVIAARRGNLPLRAILLSPVRPMLAGGIMILGVDLLRGLIPPSIPEIPRLISLVLAGAVIYGAVMFIAFRSLANELLRLLPFYRHQSEPG